MIKTKINNEIFKYYLNYQNPLFQVKDLCKANQVKNEKTVNLANDSFIDFSNDVNEKLIPKSENPEKIIDFVKKTLDFYKQLYYASKIISSSFKSSNG